MSIEKAGAPSGDREPRIPTGELPPHRRKDLQEALAERGIPLKSEDVDVDGIGPAEPNPEYDGPERRSRMQDAEEIREIEARRSSPLPDAPAVDVFAEEMPKIAAMIREIEERKKKEAGEGK